MPVHVSVFFGGRQFVATIGLPDASYVRLLSQRVLYFHQHVRPCRKHSPKGKSMAATRSAHAVWNGDLLAGSGVVSATTSNAFNDLSVSWKARTEEPGGSTSPEELVAAAHASCFSMALSAGLGGGGTPPSKLVVDATVTFEQVDGGWKVISSALNVVGTVPGLDDDGFQSAAEAAKDGCPISQMMTGNVSLSVEAKLV